MAWQKIPSEVTAELHLLDGGFLMLAQQTDGGNDLVVIADDQLEPLIELLHARQARLMQCARDKERQIEHMTGRRRPSSSYRTPRITRNR